MSVFFDRPYGLATKQNSFSTREVGLTHPDVMSYLRIADNGDIHIMVKNNCGIILSPSKDTIFLNAKYIKFLTNEEEGLKWNTLAFNPHATTYAEPALVERKSVNQQSVYDGLEDFVD